MGASIWSANSTPLVPSAAYVLTERLIATAGQTVFNITNFTYQSGGIALRVFRNGQLMTWPDDYAETSTSSFTFTSGMNVGDEIFVIGNSFVSPGYAAASALSYIQAGVGAISRTVQSRLREKFSVKDFGAVGDGVVNDDAAIVAAVAALKARGGGTLYFPTGTYNYTTTIAFTTGDPYCTIEGEMMSDTVGGGTNLKYNGAGWAITRNHTILHLRNFTLTGTVAASGGIWDGVSGTLVCSNCENINLSIYGFTGVGASAVLVYGSIRQWWRNCTFAANNIGVEINGPIALNAEWHTCSFINNTNYGLKIGAGTDHRFFNCNFERNTNQGIIIQGTGTTADTIAARLQFYGCWVEGNNSGAGSGVVGACQIFVGYGADATWNTDIVFEDLFVAHNATCGNDLSIDYATRVSLVRPLFSGSYLWVSANSVSAAVWSIDDYGHIGNGEALTIRLGSPTISLYPAVPSAGNTTPAIVSHLGTYATDSGAGRTITDFTGKDTGKLALIHVNDATTVIPNSANIITAGGKTISEQDTIVLMYFDGTVWREVARNQTTGNLVSVTLAAGVQAFVLANTDSAMMMVTDVTANKSALYSLNGSADTTTEMSDPDAGFQNATGGALIAIYPDGAGSYRIKNEYAASHDIRYTLLNALTR